MPGLAPRRLLRLTQKNLFGSGAANIASIHLTANPVLLLVIAQTDTSLALLRRRDNHYASNSTDISFTGKLWASFRALICGALDGLKAISGDAVAISDVCL